MLEPDTMVPIPTSLYRRIEAVLPRTGTGSVPEFVAAAVRSALAPHESAGGVSADDEAQIVERLRRLGYID